MRWIWAVAAAAALLLGMGYWRYARREAQEIPGVGGTVHTQTLRPSR